MKIISIVATLALLSCVMADTPDVFLGSLQGEERLLKSAYNEIPAICANALADLKIKEYRVNVKGSPKEKTMLATLYLNLDKNLFDCNLANWEDVAKDGRAKPKHEQVKHLVGYMNRPNDHNNPYDNIDIHQQGCNCDSN